MVLGLAGRKPERPHHRLAGRLVEVLLLAQIVIAIIAPRASATRRPATSLEFWVYLIAALLIPPLAVFWALIERTRWSTVVLGVAALAVAVMA